MNNENRKRLEEIREPANGTDTVWLISQLKTEAVEVGRLKYNVGNMEMELIMHEQMRLKDNQYLISRAEAAEAERDKLRGLLQRMWGHFVEIHELDWRRVAINGCAFTAREIAHMALLDLDAAMEEKEERMETFLDGEELREALATELHEGDRVCFHGVEHRVIDAGEQGLRVAAQKEKPNV